MDTNRRMRRGHAKRRELGGSDGAPPRRARPLIDVAKYLMKTIAMRGRYLPGAVFQDPEWLMTLDLFIAAEEDRAVSVSSLCFVSGVPATTALRHIRSLEEKGIFERVQHPSDRRISHVRLSSRARVQVGRYLTVISRRDMSSDEEPPIRAAH
jgi:winged helix DNA-binding protein